MQHWPAKHETTLLKLKEKQPHDDKTEGRVIRRPSAPGDWTREGKIT